MTPDLPNCGNDRSSSRTPACSARSIGSFLNVCILRWGAEPKQSVVRPPSRCPRCGQRPPLVRQHPDRLVAGAPRPAAAAAASRSRRMYPLSSSPPPSSGPSWPGVTGSALEALRGAVFGTVLLGIAMTDARAYIIPDEFSLGGLVARACCSRSWPGGQAFGTALLGAAVGFGLLWLVAVAGEWVFKQEAMGGGDIKMMAMVGAFLGWQGTLLTMFLGALIGSLIFVPLALAGHKKLVPFGIFLALGAAATELVGPGDPRLVRRLPGGRMSGRRRAAALVVLLASALALADCRGEQRRGGRGRGARAAGGQPARAGGAGLGPHLPDAAPLGAPLAASRCATTSSPSSTRSCRPRACAGSRPPTACSGCCPTRSRSGACCSTSTPSRWRATTIPTRPRSSAWPGPTAHSSGWCWRTRWCTRSRASTCRSIRSSSPPSSNDRLTAAQSVLEGQATLASIEVLAPGQGVTRTPQFWDLYRDQVRAAAVGDAGVRAGAAGGAGGADLPLPRRRRVHALVGDAGPEGHAAVRPPDAGLDRADPPPRSLRPRRRAGAARLRRRTAA